MLLSKRSEQWKDNTQPGGFRKRKSLGFFCFKEEDKMNNTEELNTQLYEKMKAEFDGNKISFNIDIKMTGRIEVLYTEQNILKEEEINKMEEAVSETVKHNLEKLIKKAQEEFEVDFLGFGEYIFRRHPKRWKEIGDRWDEIFPYIEVKYNAQAKIDNSGIISKLVIN